MQIAPKRFGSICNPLEADEPALFVISFYQYKIFCSGSQVGVWENDAIDEV
jgi:hypothetical protein